MARWELEGRTAVITGGSSGIGAATAVRLAEAGMTVIAAARRTDRLAELAAAHRGIVARQVDVTNTDSVTALADSVADEFGACHALINNAGIPGGVFFGRDDLGDALHTLDVNLSGTIRCMAAFADLLAAHAPSRVINVASVAGKLGVGPAAYAASKFGMVGFSEATSFSWARRGITVCQLNPGFIQTEGFPQRQLMRTRLSGLVGQPDDVARAIERALKSGVTETTVPRWYRPIVVFRHTISPAYRLLMARSARAAGTRD